MDADLIARFYTAFQALDAEAMASCYAEDARFSDPVFTDLRGRQVGDMWRMLCASATDLSLTFDSVTDASAHWVATYTFPSTGRRVVNDIRASFVMSEGLIQEHRDTFDLWAWSRQALGPTGVLLGWTPLLQGKVRGQAMAGLRRYQQHG
jgi:hypothetical protein